MEDLSYDIRSVLRNLSLQMHRLRAFSRQYTGRLTSYEEISNFSMSDTGGNTSKSNTPKSSSEGSKKISRTKIVTSAYQKLLHNRLGTIFTDILFDNNSSSQQHFMDMESISSLQATSLQCRIKKVVYIIQVGNLLMMYRPHNGAQHIQLFGGIGFIVFSNVFKQNFSHSMGDGLTVEDAQSPAHHSAFCTTTETPTAENTGKQSTLSGTDGSSSSTTVSTVLNATATNLIPNVHVAEHVNRIGVRNNDVSLPAVGAEAAESNVYELGRVSPSSNLSLVSEEDGLPIDYAPPSQALVQALTKSSSSNALSSGLRNSLDGIGRVHSGPIKRSSLQRSRSPSSAPTVSVNPGTVLFFPQK